MFANRFALAVSTLFFLALLHASQLAIGEELRIETDVYAGDATEPLSHNVTLFDSGTVYDYSQAPEQIIVFRAPSASHPGQFILLDVREKQRTEVSTKRIDGLMKKLTRWAAEQEEPLLKFSADPQFEEQFDEESGTLSLTSDIWQYRVATVPAENAAALAQYREFTDWYTKLNAMMHSTPPPGPRLKLNAALQSHGVVPVEIRRTVESETTAVRATHLFTWRLSREDRARLEQTARYLTSFEKVNNEDFVASRTYKEVVRGQSK
ncbi:MAG: hypothetical protein KDA57_08720 [Planctomycetales bacterium]|nr:hypothetical protein [Planctomycetales bacterium]